MSADFETSVTAWIRDLKQGNDDAARRIWERYFPQLLRVANRRLGQSPRRTFDEEDIAVSVFDSLCQGAAAGRFAALDGRDDLWKLLVAITGMKSVDKIRHQLSKKRGGQEVRGHSVLQPDGAEIAFAEQEPTPEFLMAMEEQQEQLFGLLRDDVSRHIAQDRLAGYSNQEIADRLGISVRSVERKLQLIRDTWKSQLDESQPG